MKTMLLIIPFPGMLLQDGKDQCPLFPFAYLQLLKIYYINNQHHYGQIDTPAFENEMRGHFVHSLQLVQFMNYLPLHLQGLLFRK